MIKEKEIKFRITNADKKKTNGNSWSLYYHVTNFDGNTIMIRVVNFKAATQNEALKKALNLLKASAKRISPNRIYKMVTLMISEWHPWTPTQEENLFQLKWRIRTPKAILKIKEEYLEKYFVRGCGPKALEQLREGL